MAPTRGHLNPTYIHLARVLDVDINTYTLTIATEFSQKPLSNISFATPYMHPFNGEGIYFMPEVGSLCWLAEPSDGSMPFILAWSAAQNEGDFRAHRQDLNPGDIYLGTRDENQLVLRRGGVVQIGSTGICQRIFMPVNNLIRDMCENYELHTFGGDLTWNVARSEKDKDGNRPAILKLYAKEFANETVKDSNGKPAPVAALEIGSHGTNDKTILSLIVRNKGGGVEKIILKMDKDGNVSWTIAGNLKYKVTGDYSLDVTGEIAITGQKSASVTTKGAFKVSSDQNIELKSKAAATVEASSGITLKSNTDVGEGASTKVVIMTGALEAWLNHKHLVTAPSELSGPPVPSLLSPACTATMLKAK